MVYQQLVNYYSITVFLFYFELQKEKTNIYYNFYKLRFFADVKTENSSTIPNTFKFFSSTKYKDFIVKIKEQVEKRLNDEQKAVCIILN